jgi:hypothetical protein
MTAARQSRSPSRRTPCRCHPRTWCWTRSISRSMTSARRLGRAAAACHAGRAAGDRAGRRPAGRPWRPAGRGPPRTQAAHRGPRHGRWRGLHRRCGAAALWVDRQRAWPSGDGRLHRGDLAARLHLWPYLAARQGDRQGPGQGGGGGRRARRWAALSGRGLHHLRGPRLPQAGRLLRLHPPAGLPPAAGHQGRYRRGAARPATQRRGQHRPRHRPVR